MLLQLAALAFTHVTVIDGTDSVPRRDRTVVISGARITAVGPASSTPAPKGARILDGRGKYLVPGFWDMHVHTAVPGARSVLGLYVANGVTGVRDMGGDWALLTAMRAEVRSGRLWGPRLVLSEVMASPPLPTPRSDGEYVEIWNAGATAADLSRAALEGGDGTVRPLAADATEAIVLAAGARALAVGASFDAGRYSLPAGLLLLRASTQRLLGRGLSDDSPPLIILLASDAEGTLAEVDRYPGAGPVCPAGRSIEATEGGAWVCGADGGSPGRPP